VFVVQLFSPRFYQPVKVNSGRRSKECHSTFRAVSQIQRNDFQDLFGTSFGLLQMDGWQPANCKLVGVRLFSIHFLGYLGVLTLSPRLTGGGN